MLVLEAQRRFTTIGEQMEVFDQDGKSPFEIQTGGQQDRKSMR